MPWVFQNIVYFSLPIGYYICFTIGMRIVYFESDNEVKNIFMMYRYCFFFQSAVLLPLL